jgi:Family of unknown function (DUF6768)
MSDIDKLIDETLSAEDRDLLNRYGGELGFFAEAMSAFRGPRAWVFWLVNTVQALLFFLGLYLAWRFFQSQDVIIALRFGLSALLSFLMGAVLKMGMGMMIESNRVIREVKRLELQVARAQINRGG